MRRAPTARPHRHGPLHDRAQMRRHRLVGDRVVGRRERGAVLRPGLHARGVVGMRAQPGGDLGALGGRAFAVDPGAELFVGKARRVHLTPPA
ncbi:MAG: hypothetical protein IPM15_22330 [Betaproteobacteria bacterium]|nr:hypothetical protein [Betaproteobacteria bacterium]